MSKRLKITANSVILVHISALRDRREMVVGYSLGYTGSGEVCNFY